MKARVYKGHANAKLGGHIQPRLQISEEPKFEPVTAYDSEPVDALVEAARQSLARLNGCGWGQPKLEAALAPFGEEGP